MTAFYNDVNNWLSVGGDLDLARDLTRLDHDTNVKELQAHGITHVLDVRIEWDDRAIWSAHGLPAANYCHAPITDLHGYNPPQSWYDDVEGFVRQFLADAEKGDRLYVHCHMGINRGPSAAMLALLVATPTLWPFDAFMQIRDARPTAGLVYAEAVGRHHLLNRYTTGSLDEALYEFAGQVGAYWTPELRQSVRQGIAYYRSAEGGTNVVSA